MLRKLLAALLAIGVTSTLAGALFWSISGNTAWAEGERKNCPDGFHWDRMSGTCCVQDRETLPVVGMIGYTGESICMEGYSGVYDHRPTTDGKGPPGCPNYTSFAFLEKCLTPAEYEEFRQQEADSGAAMTGGGTPGNRVQRGIRDASEALFGGGSGLSNRDLGAAGTAATAVVIGSALVGGGARLASRRIKELTDRLRRIDREMEEALRRLEAAREARESLRRKRRELQAATDRVKRQLEGLARGVARAERNLSLAGTAKGFWMLAGLCLAAAAVIPAVTAYAAASAAGAVAPGAAAAAQAAWVALKQSLLHFWGAGLMTFAGHVSGRSEQWTAVKDGLAKTKANAALYRGIVETNLDHVQRACDQADQHFNDAERQVENLRAQRMQAAKDLAAARQG